jgi:hypothetical protein
MSVARRLAAGSALLLAGYSFAQNVLAPRAEKAPRNTLALAASTIGARQCLSEISSLSSLAIQDTSNNDVLFDWDHQRMGGGPVFSLLGLNFPSSGAAMSVTAVPEPDGTCSVAAERMSFEAVPCKQVARRELPGYHATPLLAHMTVYSDPGDRSSSVSLIDSSPGCLVIRRYVKFSAPAGSAGR